MGDVTKLHTKLDWDAEHVRVYESGIAIDVYGETRFIRSEEVIDASYADGRAYVTLPRPVASRVMARPRTISSPDQTPA